jgi:predicted DNA-binding protein (MmcQ/YjbR family)
MTTSADARARMEAICGRLPEAEAAAAGEQHLACTVRGRTFAYLLDDHHGDGRLAINIKVAPGRNTDLAAGDPQRFFIPAYVGPRGWAGMFLDVGEVDWYLVGELVADSFRLVAPKRLVRELDAGGP